jgi:hypothetical protein
MEEGCQKSKRLSYTAKFKREVVWCAEAKGNRKSAAIFGEDESKAAVVFGVNENNVQLWWKLRAAISKRVASQKKFTGPKKG